VQNWIFTFGSNHPFRNQYVTITARSHASARDLMVAHFNLKWSHQYDVKHESTREMIDHYHLTEVAHISE